VRIDERQSPRRSPRRPAQKRPSHRR
jgi:hypothetical protein